MEVVNFLNSQGTVVCREGGGLENLCKLGFLVRDVGFFEIVVNLVGILDISEPEVARLSEFGMVLSLTTRSLGLVENGTVLLNVLLINVGYILDGLVPPLQHGV